MKQCLFCKAQFPDDALKSQYCGKWIETLQKISDLNVDSSTTVQLITAQRYEIVEVVGRGGMSVVYKAMQKNLNRPVALKILPQQFNQDQEFLQRFHREARAATRLNYSNIITVYDNGVANGIHYIAMEYIKGHNLQSNIQQNGVLPAEHINE